MGDIITSMFETLSEIAAGFSTFLVSLFENVVQLFWTEGEGGTGGQLTLIGTFLLIGMAVGLFMWAFRYIKGLIRIDPTR